MGDQCQSIQAGVSDRRGRDIKNVQIILKTSERCNIACKYCYFFFGDSATFKEHPSLISRDTIKSLVAFLSSGVQRESIETVTIGFHGGEPLLQRKNDFDWMCSQLRDSLSNAVQLDLLVQTNGMLIDSEWIDLFAKHNVRVGISLDGPEVIHDKNRIDRKKRGTHERVLKGLSAVQDAFHSGKLIREPSVLCVIDPNSSAVEQFEYFRRKLKLNTFDFLLPETELAASAEEYGVFLVDLFRKWIEEGDPELNLRFFKALLLKFMGKSSFIFPIGQDRVTSSAFKVSSDGRLYPDDVIHNDSWATPHLNEISLSEWLQSEPMVLLDNIGIPESCRTCCWSKVCGGGHPWNRYAPDGTFSRPSTLCNGLKYMYSDAYRYLIEIGVSEGRLKELLGVDSVSDCRA